MAIKNPDCHHFMSDESFTCVMPIWNLHSLLCASTRMVMSFPPSTSTANSICQNFSRSKFSEVWWTYRSVTYWWKLITLHSEGHIRVYKVFIFQQIIERLLSILEWLHCCGLRTFDRWAPSHRTRWSGHAHSFQMSPPAPGSASPA